MFSSPEKRTKKESIASKNKQDSNNQSGFDKNENTSSKKLDALHQKSKTHSENSGLARLQEKANNNNTGLPDQLKLGMETISGISLDDVKVNYNSDKPSDLGAHAYAEGNQIHVAGGQEKHLAHEAWHVIQQKQGRVKPTTKYNGVEINDSIGLENEATMMGDKAKSLNSLMNSNPLQSLNQTASANTPVPQLMYGWADAKKYSDKENNGENKGFLKGTLGGVLGSAGGAVGGVLGGLTGVGKGIYNKVNNKGTFSDGFMDTARAGVSMGRKTGRTVGSGIVDGTKAIAGSAVGAAGATVGALGGAAYGGYSNGLDGVSDGFMSGGKAGFDVGYKGTNALIETAEEAPGFALDVARTGVGAAGATVGALGGAAYGAYNNGLEGASDGFMSGGKAGFELGANSEGSKFATSMAVTTGASLLGGPLAGGLASGATTGYFGGTNEEQEKSGVSSLAGGLTGLGEVGSKLFKVGSIGESVVNGGLSFATGKVEGAINDKFEEDEHIGLAGMQLPKTKKTGFQYGKSLLLGENDDGSAKNFTDIDEENSVQNKVTERGKRIKDRWTDVFKKNN